MLGLPPPRISGGEPSHRDRTRQGMLTKSWRRKRGEALAVLTVLTSLTGVAQAQQGGLFPLAPIRRERTPCPAEEPVYKLYRSQYFGYYPPQWRPFPSGWHLKSPQLANREEELKSNLLRRLHPRFRKKETRGRRASRAKGGRPFRTHQPTMSDLPLKWTSRITVHSPRQPVVALAGPRLGLPWAIRPRRSRRPRPRPSGGSNAPGATPRATQPNRPAPRLPDAGSLIWTRPTHPALRETRGGVRLMPATANRSWPCPMRPCRPCRKPAPRTSQAAPIRFSAAPEPRRRWQVLRIQTLRLSPAAAALALYSVDWDSTG